MTPNCHAQSLISTHYVNVCSSFARRKGDVQRALSEYHLALKHNRISPEARARASCNVARCLLHSNADEDASALGYAVTAALLTPSYTPHVFVLSHVLYRLGHVLEALSLARQSESRTYSALAAIHNSISATTSADASYGLNADSWSRSSDVQKL